MATIFMEQTETGSVSWMLSPSSATADATFVAGSWSTYSLKIGSTTTAQVLWANATQEHYGQARFYCPSAMNDDEFRFKFMSPNGTRNCMWRIGAGFQLEWWRGDAGTKLGTGTTVLLPDRWYLVSWYLKVHDTAGSITMKVDGVTETFTWVTGTSTTQDTRNDAAAGGDTIDRVELTSVGTDYFDDIIINDLTGTTNVTYPNALGIEALMPTAAGDNTGMTPSAGANWQNVDERPPNDVTDYNSHATANTYDLYNIPSTQWTAVSAVGLSLRAASSDAGAKNIAHRVKADTDASGTADTEYTGSDLALSTSWTYYTKYYDQQPDSTNWTAAKVNALQPGAVVRT